MVPYFYVAVEGKTDVAVAKRIIRHLGFRVKLVIDAGRKTNLRKSISAYNKAANHVPWFVLTDLDSLDLCPVEYAKEWLPDQSIIGISTKRYNIRKVCEDVFVLFPGLIFPDLNHSLSCPANRHAYMHCLLAGLSFSDLLWVPGTPYCQASNQLFRRTNGCKKRQY